MEDLKTEVNSRSYWNNRFDSDWEQNSGRQQTLYFAEVAHSLFPNWFHEILASGVTVADVGCAEGDGVHHLAPKYPKSHFVGIDFSEEAIERALKLYPEYSFYVSDIKEMDQKFDVIFSSNTLEHFYEPFEILHQLFEKAERYVVILIPFQERNRFKEHFYTFEYSDFQIDYKDFDLVYSREYDCSKVENIFWAGKQLLLIFERKNINSKHKRTLGDYIGNLSEEYDILNNVRKELLLKHERLSDKMKIEINKSKNLHVDIEILKTKNSQLDRLIETQFENINDLLNKHNYYESVIQEVTNKLDYAARQEQWLNSELYRLTLEMAAIKKSLIWKSRQVSIRLAKKSKLI
ncbi:class I SAM-dependent methyltransferase, partial [Cohnella sp. JJ-181]|uniref:class I SAM-dependent methyltransferase n=1 Tax=Cohnella rhizoplanae TaxID=2974897 RepID=UPI00232B329C